MKIEYIRTEAIGPTILVTLRKNTFGLCFCHRMKMRSIWFFGLQNFLCARCTGVCIGGVTGTLLLFTGHLLNPLAVVLFVIPLLIDGFSQALVNRESNNGIRVITGILCGISAPFIGFYMRSI